MNDDLEQLHKLHTELRVKLPTAWSAFFARFGSLRPVQLAATPVVLSGKNVLITAPTAGGKTEAVMAPLCEQIVKRRSKELSVLLVTPTRALVNDLFARLEKPCEQMGVQIGRKTADHGQADSLKCQLLVTTPESLESMLTFRKEVLSGIRSVVLDEIHLLDGTARGDQLRLVLARLSAFLSHRAASPLCGLQLVAMSATVPEPKRIADAYLGAGAEIVVVPGQRQLQSRVIVAGGPLENRVHSAVDAIASFSNVTKVLVFFNSRKEVDAGAAMFQCGPFQKAAIFGHHGSLSKERREMAESRFKSEARAICVATMTLEVGIDIGDIDLVVCMDPPGSIGSFLQRIGRGCRRMAGMTRVLCVARGRASEILFASMLRQSQIGLPVGPAKPFRSSVLVQQLLAYFKQVDRNCRTIEQLVRVLTSSHAPPITSERLKQLLDDLVGQGLLDKRGQVYQPASRGWDFIQSSRIYTNIEPTPMEVTLVDADTGGTIANVANVSGNQVRVAGRTYELVVGGKFGEQRVRAATGGPSDSPKYHSVRLPHAADLGVAVAGFLGLKLDALVAIPIGAGSVVVTWLGKLLNDAIGSALSGAGWVVRTSSFAIRLEKAEPSQALALISKAVDVVLQSNPLGRMKVESVVDLGPYLDEMSDRLRQIAREDWFDAAYLRAWRDTLQSVEVIDPDSSLGEQLLAVA